MLWGTALALAVACVTKSSDDDDTGSADGADGAADGADGTDVVDADGDGSPADEDCDDDDASVFPGADEVCDDGADNDCDASIDCNDDGCGGDTACQPLATAVSPDMAVYSVAEALQITGAGFEFSTAGTPTVTVGGVACAGLTVVDGSTLTCTLTAVASGRQDVVVTTDNGSVTLPAGVAVYAPLYAASGRGGVAGNLYELDPTTNAVVEKAALTEGFTSLAFAPDGTLYGLQSTEYGADGQSSGLYTIDPFSGASTRIGDLVEIEGEDHDAMPDATFVGSNLVAWSEADDAPTVVDLGTGAVTSFPDPGIGSSGTGLAADAGGTTHLIANLAGGNIFLINATTGEVTDSGVTLDSSSLTDFEGASGGLSFFGGVLYPLDCSEGSPEIDCKLLTVDTATGVLTDTSMRFDGGVDSLASIRP